MTPTTTTAYYAEAENLVSGLTFAYTGVVQRWVVPTNCFGFVADVQGVQAGAYNVIWYWWCRWPSSGDLSVTPGKKLYFCVGQQGTYYTSYTGIAAFNGGGIGAWSTSLVGAVEVRQISEQLQSLFL